MKGDLAQLFSGFTTQDSLLILVFLIVAFLLGLLAGWFFQNAKVRKLERTLHNKEEQMQVMTQERSRLDEELALRDADLKRAAFELEESQAARRHLLDQNQRLQQEIDSLHLEVDKAQTANRQYLSTIEDLNDQILGLKTRQAQLAGQGGENLPEPITGLEGPHSLIGSFAEKRLAEIEERLHLLEQEKEQQRLAKSAGAAEVHDLPIGGGPVLEDRLLEVEDDEDEENGEEALFEPRTFILPTQPEESRSALIRDDLSQIDGIGPFLEKKLNDIGVYTFAQISEWDEAQIQEVTRQIQFFEGRIQKDDWVGQAQRLAAAPPPAPDPANPEDHPHHDDLKLVEGIGPAIENILKMAGIHTFEALAKSDPEEIESLVQVAEPKLRFINASTWPAQARLAMNKEWEVLKDYQDQLRAGRPTMDEDEG